MKLAAFKRTVAVTTFAMMTAIAGLAGQAQAFSFGDGDLVLAIYGNNTEALVNLGNYNTLLASGPDTPFNVSSELAAASVGGNAVKYTIFGWDTSLPSGQIHSATAFDPGAIPTSGINLTNQLNPSVNMAFLPSFSGNTIAKSDPGSFSSVLDSAGDGKLAGAWTVAMQGSLDQVLNILAGNVSNNSFSQVGRVLLTAAGQLSIGNPGPAAAPVPLPAGVVLFGTGLIGLAGIARRSFNRMAG